VTIQVGSERRTLLVGRGRRAIEVFPGKVPPGSYPVTVRAVDLAGNPAEIELPDATVKFDTIPPAVVARLAGKRLIWRAKDAETPWLDLRLQLVGGPHNNARVVQLGKKPLRGAMRLVPKPGIWKTTLIARDSSGNRTDVPLGLLLGRR
jgi:hypothetical protein